MDIVKSRFFAGNNMDRPTSAILHSNNYNTFSRDGQGEGEPCIYFGPKAIIHKINILFNFHKISKYRGVFTKSLFL